MRISDWSSDVCSSDLWSRAERGFAMMDDLVFKAGGWLGLALLALIFAALAVDTPFAVHMIIVAITCLIVLWTRISRADYAGMARGLLKIPPDEGVYEDRKSVV